MKYYKGYPIVLGKFVTKSMIKARCPYCDKIEHFTYNKGCSNPTRRLSHCVDTSEYYYIYLKGGDKHEK